MTATFFPVSGAILEFFFHKPPVCSISFQGTDEIGSLTCLAGIFLARMDKTLPSIPERDFPDHRIGLVPFACGNQPQIAWHIDMGRALLRHKILGFPVAGLSIKAGGAASLRAELALIFWRGVGSTCASPFDRNKADGFDSPQADSPRTGCKRCTGCSPDEEG
jgi:hypothetical protein